VASEASSDRPGGATGTERPAKNDWFRTTGPEPLTQATGPLLSSQNTPAELELFQRPKQGILRKHLRKLFTIRRAAPTLRHIV